MTRAVEEAWRRGYPILRLDVDALSRLLGSRVLDAELLAGGLRNTNYRLRLPDAQVVVRFYAAEAAACAREVTLLPLVAETVPVPRVLDARPDATPPWALFEYVEGVRFDYVPPDELEAAAFDAGQVLARIHAFSLPRASSVDLFRYAGGGFSAVELIDNALARGAAARLGPELAERVVRVVRDRADWLSGQDGCLQHSDYKPWNLLVRDGRIAAVLDWEFAFAGPRLNDVGNFLRYSERQPPIYLESFVRGYGAGGGSLPDDWFRMARLQDLLGLCYFFARPDDPAITRDVLPLIERTLDLFST